MTKIADDLLVHVSGGGRHARHHHSTNPFGFLDAPYKGLVFDFASHIGGNKLADRMYGRHTTAEDRARARSAMKRFLVAGNKLPNGVPNLFG